MVVRAGHGVRALLAAGVLLAGADGAAADLRNTNPVAVFSGLDKITGRIITFDVYMDETVQFGALRVTPRICYSRPSTEAPQTDGFVEVDEITLSGQIQRIFTGWMFAASPGLNAVDHAIYDVWLIDCRSSTKVPPPEGFDMSKYVDHGLGVIERPEGWQPVPLPRPVAGPATAGTASEPAIVDEVPTDAPED